MRTRCVGHACLDIEVGGLRVVTDPWWAGPAYAEQWHAWPSPDPADLERRPADFVYLSHGHSDHLHPATLARLAPGATALVPEFVVSGGFVEFVHSLGFERVVPLHHRQQIALGRGVTATCYINVTDSILVLEHRGRALVNGNDALHASPAPVIDHFCELIARNHPHIETLFLGYGGASWYPNCVRYPGKDDLAEARAREDLFTRNFARVARALRPRLACAFAASFVLLEPHNRWINEVKFDGQGPEATLRRYVGAAVRSRALLPGDVVEDGILFPGPCEPPTRAALETACQGVLREASEAAARVPRATTGELSELALRLDERLREHRLLPFFAPALVEFRIRDSPGAAILLRCENGGSAVSIEACGAAPVGVELRSQMLRAILTEPFGSESVTIGYGAVAHVQRREQLKAVTTLLRGLEPRPHAARALGDELRRNVVRTSTAIARQSWPLALKLVARLGLGQSRPVEPLLYRAEVNES
jgi:L-ascorbate metabolism protein UlaG (beta-lactamase superfamily)